MEVRPTTRFMIEPSLVCNIKCKFCYHLHKYDTWKDTVKSFDAIKKEIDAGLKRGNDYMDITGGEPTVYPHICETVSYALQQGIRTCIITNGIVSKDRHDKITSAGLDGWLVSRHGTKETHDFITNLKGSYDKQEAFLQEVKKTDVQLRFNCVISAFNHRELLDVSMSMAQHNPEIVNFINMNPHGAWSVDVEGTRAVIADLKVAQSNLELAISYLETMGVKVNIRYYPMCRIKEEYRSMICNDLHVMFDPYEWDYCEMPKTFDQYRQWGINTSQNVENKNKPCTDCDLIGICGGVNKHYLKAAGDCVTAQRLEASKDFYHYRRSAKTLEPR